MTSEKRLYRSLCHKTIAGVCGGLAEHFNIDPVIVRIVFVLAALGGGGGVIIYIILWIVIPVQTVFAYETASSETTASTINSETTHSETINSASTMENQFETKKEKRNYHGNLTGGLILITLGILFLIARFVPRVDFGDLWPVILIVVGITILLRNLGKKKNDQSL